MATSDVKVHIKKERTKHYNPKKPVKQPIHNTWSRFSLVLHINHKKKHNKKNIGLVHG